jgi:hypothetical protein
MKIAVIKKSHVMSIQGSSNYPGDRLDDKHMLHRLDSTKQWNVDQLSIRA